MGVMEICCICLKDYSFLEPISDQSEDKTTFKQKLKACVPNEIWYKDYKICRNCSEQLELAYQFIIFCVKNKKKRKTVFSKLKKPFYCINCDKSYSSEQYLKQHISKLHTNIQGNSVDSNKCEKTPVTDAAILYKQEEIEPSKEKLQSSQEDENKLIGELKDKIKNENVHTTVELLALSPTGSFSVSSFDSDDLKPLKQLSVKKSIIKRKRHVRRHVIPKEPIKCEECSLIFKKRQLLLNHTRSKHTFEKPYKCDLCDAGYLSYSSLLVHKRWHNNERPFICTVCGKGFRCLKTLKVHQETHDSVRAHPCNQCEKSFKTDSNLRMHKQIVHTNPEDYKYVCSKCGKKSPTKSNLDSHIKRNHAGERNFICHICNQKFLFNHEVNTHIRRKHRDERLYPCEVCKKGFKSSYGLKKHLKTAHNLGNFKGNLVPVKKHLCPYCPKMFPFNNKLQRHILTHTGEKPFKCEMCTKGFREHCGLKSHMKSEHQIESF